MDTIPEPQNQLKEWILRKLSVREHSRAELLRKALDAGYSKPDAECGLDWAAERGYQSDQRFLEGWVREWRRQGRGPHWMKAKLKQKGIILPHGWEKSQTTTDQSLDIEGREPDEAPENAKKWVHRRYPKFRESYAEKRKALAALLRRGFSFEVAEKILSTPTKDASEL